MAKNNINLELKVENIGPIKHLDFSDSLSNLKMLILAKNGTGKTFLGRNFRLFQEKNKVHEMNLKHMIKFNSTEGKFEFKISDNSGIKSDIGIAYSQTTPTFREISNDYIYHCFNHEFVEKNLREKQFNPEGNFEGFIIGENQISLETEELAVDNLKKSYDEKKTELEKKLGNILNIIDSKKEELKSNAKLQGKLTKIYDEIIFDKYIESKYEDYDVNTYDNLVSSYNKFNSIPDTLMEIKKIEWNQLKNSFNLANLVSKSLLEKRYSRADFSEEFKKKINSKKDFIEKGIEIYSEDKNQCPFCSQKIEGQEAIGLIEEYEKYLSDEENIILKKLNQEILKIKNLVEELNKFYTSYVERESDFNENKSFFPTFKDIIIKSIKIEKDSIVLILQEIIGKYEKKKENIEKIINLNIGEISEFNSIEEKCTILNKNIDDINKIINNSSQENTKIRTDLVKAISNEVCKFIKQDLENYKELKLEELDLNDTYLQAKEVLAEKRRENIASKKEKYLDTFLKLLKMFFGAKYTYCKDSSCLILNEVTLYEGAEKVLSEGEKSIISFCHYLASTHDCINIESDYKKIFFIIDDPISSMDYTYTYTLSQVLRNINLFFDNTDDRQKIILFTHNFEFASLLSRNNIFNSLYYLKNNINLEHTLEKVDKKFLFPYEEHLKTIYNISKAKELPSHTTGNSIRYVLESIMRFSNPKEKELENFIRNNTILSEQSEIYSIVNDTSHGNVGGELSLVNTIDINLIDACKSVIRYIEESFPKKLEGI